MNLADLAAVYALAGAASAVAVYRATPGPRGPALARALVSIALWPIWAPLVLTNGKPKRAPREKVAETAKSIDPNVARVEATLAEAVKACAGTPLEALLSNDAATRIAFEMRAAALRHAEVVAALQDPSLDPDAAEAKLLALEAEGAPERAIATARLHRDGARRLVELRDRDARALAEIAELTSALKTQLWLARVAGSSELGAGDLVAELWARVEGLSAATPEAREVA